MTIDIKKELVRYFRPKEKAFILAAIHYLDEDEIAKVLKKKKLNITRYVEAMGGEAKINEYITKVYAEKSIKKLFNEKKTRTGRRGRRNANSGIRKDLSIFFRSTMEANVARWLNEIYGRDNWTYEGEWLLLGVDTKGTERNYLPDFKVKDEDNSFFYVEVKGYFDSKDKKKMKMFFKKYPDQKILFISSKYNKKLINFVEKYDNAELMFIEDIAQQWSSKIKEWE